MGASVILLVGAEVTRVIEEQRLAPDLDGADRDHRQTKSPVQASLK